MCVDSPAADRFGIDGDGDEGRRHQERGEDDEAAEAVVEAVEDAADTVGK